MAPRYIFSLWFIGILVVCSHLTNAEKDDAVATTTEKAHMEGHMVPNPSDISSIPAPKGMKYTLGNLTIYESPFDNSSKVLLIGIHDIFGLHPHVQFVSDQIAESSPAFRVIIPDFFHGNPLPLNTSRTTPGIGEKLAFLQAKNGSWVGVRQDLLDIIAKYKGEGVTTFGIFGFCWGGKMIVYTAADPDFSDVKAYGLVHPSRIENEEAEKFTVPAILLPSHSEQDMLPMLEILNKNVKPESEHHRFDNVGHGFTGAVSDFSNSTIRASVDEVIHRLSKFFTKVLVKPE